MLSVVGLSFETRDGEGEFVAFWRLQEAIMGFQNGESIKFHKPFKTVGSFSRQSCRLRELGED